MLWKQIVEGSPPYLLSVAAAISFISAVWLAWTNKVAAAALLGGLFLLCVVLAYFPQLDSITAFSIDVKLRKSLDRAEDILAKIKNISVLNAKATYINVAWSNRLGGMAIEDKQKLLDAVDEQLRAVGVDDGEIKSLRGPYVELIGYDLYMVFWQSARELLRHHLNDPTPAEGGRRLSEWEARSRPTGIDAIRPSLSDAPKFRELMRKQVPDNLPIPQEKEKLLSLLEKIVTAYSGCVERGGYTEAAMQILNRYNDISEPDRYYTAVMEQ